MAAPVAQQPTTPVPLTELEEIQLNINVKADESLESTRRMLALCEESKDAGIRTLVMLDEQGEQLDRIDEGMDQINQDMKEAEKNLVGMDKCCGLCVCPWNKGKNFEKGGDYAETWKGTDDGKVGGGPRVTIADGHAMGPTGGYLTRITKDAREDEMEDNLGQVATMMSTLRNMAVDMGGEIEMQNNQLGRIQAKAESNADRVNAANEKANQILKKA